MPTEKKSQQVQDLRTRLERCHIAIATDFRGMSVAAITDLRRRLRERGIEYKVVKNRLALLAAQQAQKPEFQQLLEGPTGVAFGYDDPQVAAKVLDEYVRTSRSSLVVRAALLDGRLLTGEQVRALATLPPREQLVSRLLGQLQALMVSVVTVLSSPLRGLATVLQRRVEQIAAQPSPG